VQKEVKGSKVFLAAVIFGENLAKKNLLLEEV